MIKKVIFSIGISAFLLSGIFAATVHNKFLSELKKSATMTQATSTEISADTGKSDATRHGLR